VKIATWNLERVGTSSSRISPIIDCLRKIEAGILILTEANSTIDLGSHYYAVHSSELGEGYKPGERRVSIYSKFAFGNSYETFRNDTSICYEVNTPFGPLAIYATVIGILGNRQPNFITDLDQQIADIERIAATTNICVAGDFNLTFSDNYYFTEEGRDKMNLCFQKFSLYNLTGNIPANIDHIVLPKSVVTAKTVTTETWNEDKKLSDHKGVAVTIE
jgi:endonuclease/exonuclease/phosphatase family metal-dependent hydrolase